MPWKKKINSKLCKIKKQIETVSAKQTLDHRNLLRQFECLVNQLEYYRKERISRGIDPDFPELK